MAIEAVKVPADVQVEEKIIGPIGLRQVFILIGTGGLSYVFWSIAKNTGMSAPFQILSWLPIVIGAAFAFVKVHDVTLTRLVLLSIEKLQKPSRRTFGPRAGITIAVHKNGPDKKKRIEKDPHDKDKIQELSSILDTKMNEAASEEEDLLSSLRESNSVPIEEEDVRVSPMDPEQSIDGIRKSQKQSPESPHTDAGIFRDITPPSAA